MVGRILLYLRRIEWIAVLESEYSLVLGAVVLVHAPNILQQRSTPNEKQEQEKTNNSVHQVEDNLLAEDRIHALQFRGRHQGQKLVHENKKADGKNDIDGGDPPTNFQLLLVRFAGRRRGLQFVERNVGRKLQRSKAQRHGVSQGDDTAHDWPGHPFMFFGKPLQRLTVN